MSDAKELFQTYLDNVRNPEIAAALFADDGVVELPALNARAEGPAAVQGLLENLLKMVPEFRFEEITYWIETPDRVLAEYVSDGDVAATGKRYQQTYFGVLIAENGKIKRLRESMDTALVHRVMQPD